MKILIVRHGDPDYSIDSLTETGWKEAEACALRMKNIDEKCGGFRGIYVSSLGRAKDTASCTLKLLGREDAVICDWLREFWPRIKRPDSKAENEIVWDWLPQDWTKESRYYHPTEWKNTPVMKAGGVDVEYDYVCQKLDELLASYGYERCKEEDGQYYNVVKPNNDTIVLFCHFGMECLLLSHLIHCSPMVLWHNFCAAPTSVTTIYSEERREGIASFRVHSMGDTSHLYVQGMEPSFSGRFCECYSNVEERHD